MNYAYFRRNACLAAVAATLAAPVAGCSSDEGMTPIATPPTARRHLDEKLVWYGDNRERLDALMDEHSDTSEDYDANKKPVAVFDWDNTVIKNDVGDVVMFWMLRNSKIRQPPGKNWAMTSPYLTPAAVTALDMSCSAIAEEGEPLPMAGAAGAACADMIARIYSTGMITPNEDAFAGWNYRTMEPAYAWTVSLQAGYTPAEINDFAGKAIEEALAAEIGAVQTVGTTEGLNAFIRIYDPIKDLIGALQENGFDVWILSASSQHIVEPFAAKVGIAKDHVIGVRAVLDGEGKTTYDFQGCGSVPDGANDGKDMVKGNSLITYIEGKRCWVNKVIYGDTTPAAEKTNPDADLRPVLGAGDSDTDTSFLQDATGLKLVLNRNKKEIMCNAYGNAGERWLVNPMFLGPKDIFADGYACSKDACKDKDGNGVPCVDERGQTIPDQTDTAFCKNGVYCEK